MAAGARTWLASSRARCISALSSGMTPACHAGPGPGRSGTRVSLVVATVGREHSAARPGRRQGVAGMLVIHGIWTRDALCLWAEDSALPASLPVPAGGRPSRAARPHPFAAGPDVLADALGVLGDAPGNLRGSLRDLAAKAAADEVTLWLPSAGPAPAAAPELIGQAGLAGERDGEVPVAPPVRARLLAHPRAGLRPGRRAHDPGRPRSGGYSARCRQPPRHDRRGLGGLLGGRGPVRGRPVRPGQGTSGAEPGPRTLATAGPRAGGRC